MTNNKASEVLQNLVLKAGNYNWERNAAKTGYVTQIDGLTLEVLRSPVTDGKLRYMFLVRDDKGVGLTSVSELFSANGLALSDTFGAEALFKAIADSTSNAVWDKLLAATNFKQ